MDETLGALLHLPRRPLLLARFGASALVPARALAEARFRGPRARALFAGLAAHAALPLERVPVRRVRPRPRRGGPRRRLALPGGRRGADRRTRSPTSSARAAASSRPARRCAPSARSRRRARSSSTSTPRQVLRVAGDRLPARYRGALGRFRYGPGAHKVDYALSAPIPWRAPRVRARRHGPPRRHARGDRGGRARRRGGRAAGAARSCSSPSTRCSTRRARRRGGTPPGPTATCRTASRGTRPPPSRRRSSASRRGSASSSSRARSRGPAALERDDANLVGGDVGGGENSLRQTLFRPVARAVPVVDAGARPVPLLGVHPAGRRRSRDVRLARRPRRAARGVPLRRRRLSAGRLRRWRARPDPARPRAGRSGAAPPGRGRPPPRACTARSAA